MIIVLAQAKGDPAADSVAKTLGNRVLARLLVGEREPLLELHHVTLVLVWSEYAASKNIGPFQRLCANAERVIVVRTDHAPAFEASRVETMDWEEFGALGVLRALGGGEERPAGRSGFSVMARMAAGLFAGFGLLAPGGAAAAPMPAMTNVAMLVKREENEARAEYELNETTPDHAEEAGPLLIDLDVYQPAPYDPEAAARALAGYVPPIAPAVTATPAPPRRVSSLLPF